MPLLCLSKELRYLATTREITISLNPSLCPLSIIWMAKLVRTAALMAQGRPGEQHLSRRLPSSSRMFFVSLLVIADLGETSALEAFGFW